MAWWRAAYDVADEKLRSISDSAQKLVGTLRAVRAALVVLTLLYFSGAPIAIVWPQFLPYYFILFSITFATVTLGMAYLVGLPLRAKSLIRLIDKGYPANARELAIRAAARKLNEQSIETEELLVDTAWNEGRKAYHKYKARAQRLKEELDAEPDTDSAEPADKS
ncbi:MAG: hypothetical protein ACPHID_08765 [Thermoplasmatota archaeon]